MKRFFKLLIIVLIACLAFLIGSALVPYSESFKAANVGADPTIVVYLFLNVFWLCLTIVYLVENSTWSGLKLFLGTSFTLFFIYSFLTQIETWFFGSAFQVLTTMDIVWIAFANGIPIFIATPLVMWLFPQKYTTVFGRSISLGSGRKLLTKLTVLGFCYMVVYFIFGYFVAWQWEPLRVFYSGNLEQLTFIDKLVDNYRVQPLIYPFQYIRGILFALASLPLVLMMKKSSRNILVGLILVYLSTGIGLIIPNILFPDVVRWVHFLEMSTSMFCLAIINWFVLVKV